MVSRRPFEEVLARLTASIGQPDMPAFQKELATARTLEQLTALVEDSIGPSQLMEFARFNLGAVLTKARGRPGPRIVRLIVGNPLLMKEMVEAVPDAASYAPLSLLIDERADGVHLSYDCLASLIAPYTGEAAHSIARFLDAKILELFESTTSQGETP